MLLKRLKLIILSILGFPLLLLAPLVRRTTRKLEEQYENDPDSLPDEVRRDMHFTRLDDKAYAELKKGNYDLAVKYAKDLLKVARDFKDHWNYGNAIHHANTILGLVAIKHDNVEKAVAYLNKAGKTPGSPQLNSFGPSFCLAVELLLKNRNSDVLDYLSQIDKFWDFGYKKIPSWRRAIESNDIPDAWQRLNY